MKASLAKQELGCWPAGWPQYEVLCWEVPKPASSVNDDREGHFPAR